jgi:hypothetical protein
MASWRRRSPRLVVLLLAVVVCADVAFDAACDPIDPPVATSCAEVSGGSGTPSDACTSFCVPDCYCCSRGETAGPVLTLPGLIAMAQAAWPTAASAPSVVVPVPDPPPLARS